MNLNESMLKIDGLDSLSLIKSGVYKDTYGCVYKGKNAILGHYRIQENHFNLNPQREANILSKINDLQLAPETLFFDKNASIIITSKIEGEHLSQSNKRKRLISRIAKGLLSLHSNDFIGITHTFRDSLIAYGEYLTSKEEENIFIQTIELYDSLSKCL
jgi:Mn2+-dependent serine/threonine protein kinase